MSRTLAGSQTALQLRLRPLAALTAAALAATAGPAAAQPQTSDRLDEIVITGSLIEVPLRQVGTAVSVLDGDELELRGYSSLSDALRTLPGISVTNAGGQGKTTTLRIRGEEAFRTLLATADRCCQPQRVRRGTVRRSAMAPHLGATA